MAPSLNNAQEAHDAQNVQDTQHAPVQDAFATVGEAAEAVDQIQDAGNESSDNAPVRTITYGSTDNGIVTTSAADAEGHPVQEIQSLCMNCHKTGTTRLLMTKIPYFREVIIMSFLCPECGFHNSEVQPAAEIREKGSKHVLKVETKNDLNRQVIKSDSCSCKFAELDIEIPPRRGQFTTVEGLLSQIKSDLESDQPLRLHNDPDTYAKIQDIITKLDAAISGQSLPLTLTVDDPAGNSWIEFVPGEPAHKWSHIEYFRTAEQNEQLGISSVPAEPISESESQAQTAAERNASQAPVINNEETEIENIETEVQTFNAVCPSCHADCPTHMKVVNIPHFKDVIIMSTVCEHCGYKSNEVKTGGAIPDHGRKITLKVTEPDDLARDILKSESCGLQIPELNLDLTPGTLGGRFTTVEGLLKQVYEELESKVFTETSDSMDTGTYNNWKGFLAKMQEGIDGKINFTIIMDDPMAASYIQNVYAPDDDPNMEIHDYERTEEQDEELGLHDMVV